MKGSMAKISFFFFPQSVFNIKRHLIYVLLPALETCWPFKAAGSSALVQNGDTMRTSKLAFLQRADRQGAGRQLSKGRGDGGLMRKKLNHKACNLEVFTLFVTSCSLGEKISPHAAEDLSF